MISVPISSVIKYRTTFRAKPAKKLLAAAVEKCPPPAPSLFTRKIPGKRT